MAEAHAVPPGLLELAGMAFRLLGDGAGGRVGIMGVGLEGEKMAEVKARLVKLEDGGVGVVDMVQAGVSYLGEASTEEAQGATATSM